MKSSYTVRLKTPVVILTAPSQAISQAGKGFVSVEPSSRWVQRFLGDGRWANAKERSKVLRSYPVLL